MGRGLRRRRCRCVRLRRDQAGERREGAGRRQARACWLRAGCGGRTAAKRQSFTAPVSLSFSAGLRPSARRMAGKSPIGQPIWAASSGGTAKADVSEPRRIWLERRDQPFGEVGAHGARAEPQIAGGPQHGFGPRLVRARRMIATAPARTGCPRVNGAQGERERAGAGFSRPGSQVATRPDFTPAAFSAARSSA